jgi:hypothetical protein
MKTTLLDVICGRKTVGRVSGKLLTNGRPVKQASWSRVLAYVEQMDVHSPGQTVVEALWFSGRLRLGRSVTDQQVWVVMGGGGRRVCPVPRGRACQPISLLVPSAPSHTPTHYTRRCALMSMMSSPWWT